MFDMPLPVSTAAFHVDRTDPSLLSGLSQCFIHYAIISAPLRALVTVLITSSSTAAFFPAILTALRDTPFIHSANKAQLRWFRVCCLFIHLFALEAGFFQGQMSRENK